MIRDRAYYDEEYVKKERSTHDIAHENHTYPNKIRRELKRLGYELRDKSEAQAAALRNGRHRHPTKGLARPEAVKEKIRKTLTSPKGNIRAAYRYYKEAEGQDRGSN